MAARGHQLSTSKYLFHNIIAFQKGNSGAKRKWDHDEICEAVKTIQLHQKSSIQSLAGTLGIPKKSTMFRIKEEKVEKVIMPVSIAAVKPLLTEDLNCSMFCTRCPWEMHLITKNITISMIRYVLIRNGTSSVKKCCNAT